MQEKRGGVRKKLAATPAYSSPSQMTLVGFETPFERRLSQNNRWVRLAHVIPWDRIIPLYDRCFGSKEGRPPISGRVVIGALIIKHIEVLSDRGTLEHISENVYMQYFLGYSSFTDEPPFTAPLFVSLRKRMSLELTNQISELVALHVLASKDLEGDEASMDKGNHDQNQKVGNDRLEATDDRLAGNADEPVGVNDVSNEKTPSKSERAPKGRLLMDATVAPQDITFPTDIKLLGAARRKSEELIDHLYDSSLHGPVKPRTYRRIANQSFLNIQKKKVRSTKQLHKHIGRQLRFLCRNLKHIEKLLTAYDRWPLKPKQYKYLLVLKTVYEQQDTMFRNRSHRIADRIVNIHQPHVRPIVRGKDRQNVEFGSKLQVSVVDGFTFLDKLDWNAFNEGGCLMDSVNRYKERLGYYPAEVLADKIYCTRENRKWLKEKGIKLAAKPLGRPSAQAVEDHVRPGQRNAIEGKFGQAKLAYGLNLIRARLKDTSESWIACIALVLNLVRLTRKASYSLIQSIESLIESLLNMLKPQKSIFLPTAS